MLRGTRLLLASIALVVSVVAVLLHSLSLFEAPEPFTRELPELASEPLRVPLASPEPEAWPSAYTDAGEIQTVTDPAQEDSKWITLNNDTALLLEKGELEKACEGFRRCYEARPGSDIFRRNLAEALARLGRQCYEDQELEAAIEAYEEVLELAPERKDTESLRRLLARWRTQSSVEEDHWSEGSDLFTLSFDTDRKDLVHNSQDVLDHLERSYEELRLYFAADPVRELGRRPIRVVLYGSSEFDRVTGLGDWAGGVFDGTVRVSVDDLRQGNWRSTLKHELVHAFLHELGGRGLPGWVNEGLAQLLEEQPLEIQRARARLQRSGRLFALDQLKGSLVSWKDTDAIARAYAQTLAFADFLRRNYGDEALRQMVQGCRSGESVEAAFERWASVPLSFAFQTFSERLFP